MPKHETGHVMDTVVAPEGVPEGVPTVLVGDSDLRESAERRGLDNQAIPAEKVKRRRFTAAYKKRIVEQADACSQAGEIGALLRREGLYSSHLATFRRQLETGTLAQGAGERKKQATQQRAKAKQQQSRALASLEQENHRLRLIIEVQKKLCELLNLPTEEVPSRGKQS
jgi:transposase